jgi:ABC-type glycerol-3-phosphate transport system substrate-binding protein
MALRVIEREPKVKTCLLTILLAALLSACGGGSEPLDSHDKTTIPVVCSVGNTTGTCT